MRILTISGATGSGRSSALQILADNAKRPVYSAQEFSDLLRLLRKGGSFIQLETETFVDEVSPTLMKQIKQLEKDYANDYVIVVAPE